MNFKGRSIGVLRNVWFIKVKLLYFGWDFYIYAYKCPKKRYKENKKFRVKAKKDYMQTISNLVEFARKRDPRYKK